MTSESPKPDTLSETLAFLEACRHEKNWGDEKFQERCDAAKTADWSLTFEELEHGARMAWRNNARCIGRLFWPSLRVRDLRHVSEPDEIYAALLEHLEAGTNQGKIQPLATIFAPATKEGPAVRIWNHQLLGYAGYEQPDGTILGDPKNLDFTRQALALGWRGEGTRFDLLPIIIQKRGAAPQLFPPPIPQALEVPLTHPDFPWFAELGLKWYVVPVLSDMLLRIGGIDVVTISSRIQTIDLQVFLSQGIDPTTKSVLVVKSVQHFRAAYAPIAREIVLVDSGGICSPDIHKLKFTKLRRPIWPFDGVNDPYAGQRT